jgi:mono/diheme cytochrome c family protein
LRSEPRRRLRAPLLAIVLAAALPLGGCTDFAGYDLDMRLGDLPWVGTMRDQVKLRPYDLSRLPAEGTVPVASPRGDAQPFTQGELESVAAGMANPVQATPEALARGEAQYLRHCAACHGPGGAGDGPVVGPGRFPFATPIGAGSVAAGYTDGYLFGVMRVGRGLMPAYGDRMSQADLWSVVHYMRRLQGMDPGAVSPAAPAGLADEAPEVEAE